MTPSFLFHTGVSVYQIDPAIDARLATGTQLVSQPDIAGFSLRVSVQVKAQPEAKGRFALARVATPPWTLTGRPVGRP
jgi:hypothetical protein